MQIRVIMRKGIKNLKPRLNDFWKCKLIKISADEILLKLKLKLLKRQFTELCLRNKEEALKILEKEIYPLINNKNKQEKNEYLSLCRFIADSNIAGNSKLDTYNQRYSLFQEIINYFPENMIEPKQEIFEHGMKV